MQYPTLRSLSGAVPSASLDARSTALVVIDFQREYFAPGRLPIPHGSTALANARLLIGFADLHRMPVFHIQHVGAPGGALFAKDGDFVDFHADILPGTHHRVLQKSTASSFASTALHEELRELGIKTLLIAGLMTHMCVSTTARDAKPLGYQVIVAGDAAATRSIDAWDGGSIDHADLHRAALTELSDSFAEILTTSAILSLHVQKETTCLS